jgi:hypothetical protein
MTNGNNVTFNNKLQAAIKKGVSKNEKNAFQLVYPNTLNNKNSLLKGKKVNKKGNDSFNIHMKILTPLEKLNWKNLEYTQGAIKMLETQFKRLHSKRPHTDFNVSHVNGSAAPLKKNKEYQKFRSLVRQILVEQNNHGTVVKMYLTDFDVQNTPGKTSNKRIELEKQVVEAFKAFITKDNISNGNQNRWSTPATKRRINNNMYQTPPQSPKRGSYTAKKLF